jgi:voltage-gated potassium channel
MRHELLLDDLPAPFRLDILHHITRELLERVPLFVYASPPLRNVLLMALKAQTYAPGVFIIRDGEIGKEIFFVSHGKLEILKDNNACGILENGDYFGDLSLILGEIRTASVRTLTYCEIFVLTSIEFNRIKQEYSEFNDVLKIVASEQQDKRSELLLKEIIL